MCITHDTSRLCLKAGNRHLSVASIAYNISLTGAVAIGSCEQHDIAFPLYRYAVGIAEGSHCQAAYAVHINSR